MRFSLAAIIASFVGGQFRRCRHSSGSKIAAVQIIRRRVFDSKLALDGHMAAVTKACNYL
jgi:hypothetical protein